MAQQPLKFTYNTNDQIKQTVPVYGNKKLKLNQACIAMQQQLKEYIYMKQNSLFPPKDSYQKKLFSYRCFLVFFTCLFLTKRKLQ